MKRSSPVHLVRRGYTLLELVIVIGVLGLAGALLVPMIGQPDELAGQAAVRQVIADLSFAQSDALSHQQTRRVLFFEDGSGYVLLRAPFDPETDYIFDPLSRPGSNGAYLVDFATDRRFVGVDIEAAQFDGTNRFLAYDELGGTITEAGTAGTGGSIIVRSTNQRYRINVSAFTGKLTVEKLSE